MSISIEPQQVPSGSWREWLNAALTLITRRWWAQASVSVAVMLLFAVLPRQAVLFYGPSAIALAVGMASVIARAADAGAPTLGALRDARLGLARLVFYVWVMQAVALAVFGVAFAGLAASDLSAGFPVHSIRVASDFIGGEAALIMLALAWCMSMHRDFFLIPLLCCLGTPLRHASELSSRGVDKNSFVLAVRFVAAWICALSALVHGLIALVLLPLSGAFLYVAFKHVFLHEEPRPEEEETAIELVVPASSESR